MIGELKHTHRGFRFYEFEDRNGYKCSLQKSSIATEDCIWLGLDSASPVKLVSGEGWVDASDNIPEGISFNTRMHLTQEQAGILAKQLLHFSETGERLKRKRKEKIVAKIIPIGAVTKLDIPVEQVLESAKSELEGCIVVGYTKDGDLYASSTYADGGTVMWMLEACKQLLFDSI